MLYMGQLSRLGYLLQERRRRFLQEWQAVGGAREKGKDKDWRRKEEVKYMYYFIIFTLSPSHYSFIAIRRR